MKQLVLALCVGIVGCGSATEHPDAGVDAGLCSPLSQTGCGAAEKCTLRADNGQPSCSPAGAGLAYSACSADSECTGGTTCTVLPPNAAFEGGQTCHPLCNPPTQAHLACAMGGTCEVVDSAARDFGFCARAKDGG